MPCATAVQVDDLSADLIISQLLLLDAEDHTKDIKLFINSPGGSITAGRYSYSHCNNYS
jgi:ATP-dependent Clp protease protease subunit